MANGRVLQFLANEYTLPAALDYGLLTHGLLIIEKVRFSRGGRALHVLLEDRATNRQGSLVTLSQVMQDGPTFTDTPSATPSATATVTQSFTPSPTFSITPTPSSSPSATPSATVSTTATPTATHSASPSATLTASPTPTATPSATHTPPWTATPTPSATPSATRSATVTKTVTPIIRSDLELPYPNPYSPAAGAAMLFPFTLREAAGVKLEIYDLGGRRVAGLVDANLPAGVHQAWWRGDNQQGQKAAAGIYLGVFRAGGVTRVRRIVVLR
jgi:hypothetical protein